MAKTILVYTDLNKVWPKVRKAANWWQLRLWAYLKYTMASLLRQTDQDFYRILRCQPGTEELLAPYLPALEAGKVYTVFDDGAQLVASLPESVSHVHTVRIDSDDLYGPEAIAAVRRWHNSEPGAQFYNGWYHSPGTTTVSRYVYRSPPCYVIRCQREGGQLRLPIPFFGHTAFRRVYRPVRLPDGLFMTLRFTIPGFHSMARVPGGWMRAVEDPSLHAAVLAQYQVNAERHPGGEVVTAAISQLATSLKIP